MFCQSALGLLSKLDIFVQYCDFVQCGEMCFVQNYHSFLKKKASIFPWSDAGFLFIFPYSLPTLQHWH